MSIDIEELKDSLGTAKKIDVTELNERISTTEFFIDGKWVKAKSIKKKGEDGNDSHKGVSLAGGLKKQPIPKVVK